MIQDLEKREVEIVYKPNAHFLITGKSGTGKTFYCCRKLEEELRKNKAMLLIDYSSSYTEKELQKNKFDIVNIGLHFFLKNVRPYAASCSEA